MRKRLGITNKYFAWGVTAFGVIAASILFFLILTRWSGAWSTLMQLLDVLAPIIYGLMLAYIFNKIMNVVENKLIMPLFYKLGKGRTHRSRRVGRAISVALTMIIALLMIGGLLLLILPQIYYSLESLASSLPDYYKKAVEWIAGVLENNPELESQVVDVVENINEWLSSWIENTLKTQAETIVTNVVGGVLSVLKAVLNISVGFVISVYVLYHKELFCAQAKKIAYGTFKVERANKIVRGAKFLDKTCGSYIASKLVDSLIVGVINYAFMMIVGMPYPMLVSVIIAITNIIPFFGPFIGGIPSGILILLVNPTHGLIFGIFTIVMQQVDGNIIYPKIQGDSLGISGFWIIVALLVFSGLFGFWGMMLGVPVFAVIYAALRSMNRSQLRSRSLPEETRDYQDIYVFDEVTKAPVYKKSALTTEPDTEPDDSQPDGERGVDDDNQDN